MGLSGTFIDALDYTIQQSNLNIGRLEESKKLASKSRSLMVLIPTVLLTAGVAIAILFPPANIGLTMVVSGLTLIPTTWVLSSYRVKEVSRELESSQADKRQAETVRDQFNNRLLCDFFDCNSSIYIYW